MKTKLLSLLFAIVINSIATAQIPGWAWAKSAPTTTIGTGKSPGTQITTDTGGNSIVTGTFNGPNITFGNTTLTCNGGYTGSYDFFIVKYNTSGNVLWAKSIGGMGSEQVSSISTDTAGNIIVTGSFTSPALAFGSTTLTNAGSFDIFIAKLDASGNVLWARSGGGIHDDVGSGVSTDANGNIFTTGVFLSFTLALGTTTLNLPDTTYHLYLTKYDASGNLLWVKTVAGNFDYQGLNIKADPSGNIFLASGYLTRNVDLGNNVTLTNTSPQNSNAQVFLAEFDAMGNTVWATTTVTDFYARCTSMSMDPGGNIFITGFFNSNYFTLGNITLTCTNTPLLSASKAFVAKYNASGNVLWAKSLGGISYYQSYGISTDSSGNAFVAGHFSDSSLVFGSTTITCVNHASDVFIVKYDASGNPLWAQSAGGAYDDEAMAIATSANGATYITGDYSSPSMAFGSTTLTCNNNPPNGQWSGEPYGYFFIAKLGNGIFTGLKENDMEALKIFPNPFSMQMTLQTEQPFENASLAIENCFGQTVKELKNISGQSIEISRDALPGGIYFVRLIQDNKVMATRKIIISD